MVEKVLGLISGKFNQSCKTKCGKFQALQLFELDKFILWYFKSSGILCQCFFLMCTVNSFYFILFFLSAQTSCLISEHMFISTGNCFSSSTSATYYYSWWQTNNVVRVSQGCHCSHYGFCASYGGQGRYW